MNIIKDTGEGCQVTSYADEEAYQEHLSNLEENEIKAPETLPTEPPEFWYIEGGKLKVELAESIESEETKRQEDLKEEALRYQSNQQSPNELAMIHGYSKEDLDVKPKAKAQKDWMDNLFQLYESKLGDSGNNTPFSDIGSKPHSFQELNEEKWA